MGLTILLVGAMECSFLNCFIFHSVFS